MFLRRCFRTRAGDTMFVAAVVLGAAQGALHALLTRHQYRIDPEVGWVDGAAGLTLLQASTPVFVFVTAALGAAWAYIAYVGADRRASVGLGGAVAVSACLNTWVYVGTEHWVVFMLAAQSTASTGGMHQAVAWLSPGYLVAIEPVVGVLSYLVLAGMGGRDGMPNRTRPEPAA